MTNSALGREILHDEIDFGCFEWFSADSIFRRWFAPAGAKQLDEQLREIQTQKSSETRMKNYAEIGKWLVNEARILPLSHENQQVSAARHVEGVRATPFGFVAFNELWLRGD